MSVDQSARDSLANDLQRLVAGEMKTDDFDDRYYREWKDSEDAAVAEIARFGWSLYSDGLTNRLKGWNAVNKRTRQASNRAVLFLGSNLKYEWPCTPDDEDFFGCFYGMLLFLGIPLGIALLFVSLCTFLDRGYSTAVLLGAGGAFSLAFSIILLGMKLSVSREFREAGCIEVWPFIREQDYKSLKASLLHNEK